MPNLEGKFLNRHWLVLYRETSADLRILHGRVLSAWLEENVFDNLICYKMVEIVSHATSL